MKIRGVKVSGPAKEYLVLPRPGQENIVFIAEAIMDMDEFERLVPDPKPKTRLEKGGWKEVFDDPQYLESIKKRAELRFAYMIIKSLGPSEIEWETVKEDQPSTWLGWKDEMLKAGFNQTEINRITNCVAAANCLDEAKLEAARESFLRGLEKASAKSIGPITDPQNTPSGEPVNDSEPDHQE